MMSCPHCGADAPPGERFCGNCGQALTVSDATRPLTPSDTPAAYIGPDSPVGRSAGGPTPPPPPGTPPPAARAPEQPTTMFSPTSDQPAAPPYSPPPAYVPPPLAAPQPTTPYAPTPTYGAVAAKDPSTAMIIEILLGLFGFLGIGHLYAGRTTPGIVLLLGWWVFLFVEAMLIFVVIGFCLFPANLIVPIVSGVWLKNEMTRPPARM